MNIVIGILISIGSLGVFLYGMNIMSGALQKIAGSKMRSILAKITQRPISGVLTGALVTSVIQSSSATTVMTVSFANAGLLSLSGAIAVIMGANIGTTITAWIISIFGLKFSIASIAVPLIAVSLPFLFNKKPKMKSIGEFIIGFSFLFMGMEMLKESIPDIAAYPALLEAIGHFSSYGYLSILFFVTIGTLATIILQSSSAMMAITLVMCAQGWVGLTEAAAMVLGENIGTTITANIAAAVANVHAKRVARSHFVFNLIGVIWMLIVFIPFLKGIGFLTYKIEGLNPLTNNAAIPVALSLFHSFFNILNTFILIWFIPQIEHIVKFLVKDESEPSSPHLSYISTGQLDTAELNLDAARKEIKIFSEHILSMYDLLGQLPSLQGEEYIQCQERIAKYEVSTDRMELEITDYLSQVTAGKTSSQTAQKILSMLRVIDNLESLGDGIYQLAINHQQQQKNQVILEDEEQNNIEKINQLVGEALHLMDSNLSLSPKTLPNCRQPDISKAYQLEEKINDYRDQLRAKHLEALRDRKYSYIVGSLYSGCYALYEKLGDYIINVTEGLDNCQRKRLEANENV